MSGGIGLEVGDVLAREVAAGEEVVTVGAVDAAHVGIEVAAKPEAVSAVTEAVVRARTVDGPGWRTVCGWPAGPGTVGLGGAMVAAAMIPRRDDCRVAVFGCGLGWPPGLPEPPGLPDWAAGALALAWFAAGLPSGGGLVALQAGRGSRAANVAMTRIVLPVVGIRRIIGLRDLAVALTGDDVNAAIVSAVGMVSTGYR